MPIKEQYEEASVQLAQALDTIKKQCSLLSGGREKHAEALDHTHMELEAYMLEGLETLNGCQYFHAFALSSSYLEVAMVLTDCEKTVWNVMMFGLCNAPATLCILVE